MYPSKPFTIELEVIPKVNEVLEVLREFREMNPWKGSPEERLQKFHWLHSQLNRIYGLNVKFVSEVKRPYTFSGASCYDPRTNTIILRGRYSVITFLHEWAHALDFSEWRNQLPLHGEYWAVAFSVTLFKTVFPDKFERLRAEGHVLVLG